MRRNNNQENGCISMFSKLARTIIGAIDGLNERIGRAVSWLTLLMVLVTFLVVVLRYAFDLGWIAMQESVTWMYALVFLLGAAYTLKHDAHVRVDIIYQRCSPATRAWIDLSGVLLLLLPMCGLVLWSSWEYVASSWGMGEGSREAGGLPGLYVLKSAIVLMGLLLLLQGIAVGLRSVLTIIGVPLDSGEG
jgi:TRAP-type mannitol/chloroaromatic compound transport system permease small subunit